MLFSLLFGFHKSITNIDYNEFSIVSVYREERRSDRREVVAASREVRRHGGQVPLRADVKNQVHSYYYVIDEMTVEQPVSCE